jgi:hypothetical protein
MVVFETDEPVTFASADEVTKKIEASDNVSASIFFIPFPFPFPFPGKNNSQARPQRRPVYDAFDGRA